MTDCFSISATIFVHLPLPANSSLPRTTVKLSPSFLFIRTKKVSARSKSETSMRSDSSASGRRAGGCPGVQRLSCSSSFSLRREQAALIFWNSTS